MSVAKLNVGRARDLLGEFDFKGLFNELGWSNPSSKRRESFMAGEIALSRTPIAELSGIVVYEVEADTGGIPDRKTQALASKETAKATHEHVLVFVDKARTQSVWYWVKREGSKRQPRDHYYFKGQPGDLFLSKIASLVVDLSELDDHGHLPLISAADKVRKALDVERVIKQFFKDYDEQRVEFTKLIVGIPDENDRRWYASVLLNRLMFIYFLQRRFFLDGGDGRYLENKLGASKGRGQDRYYGEFLKALFFEAFAMPKEKRSEEAKRLTGEIRYLNGGLFLPHALEQKYAIEVPDQAFDGLYTLFSHYSWNLNDIPGEDDNDINPDVLGYIFEKYINQKEFGAYYTRPEITEYLCEQTIHRLILDRINEPAVEGLPAGREFDSVPELLMRLDKATARKLLHSVLPDLTILDPAVGSGAFLVAALKTLLTVYSAVVGWLQFHDRPWLDTWLEGRSASLERVHYTIKKAIITDNLYGVDIMEEATEIAKLRLFMTLVASAHTVEELEPLPNIDFNILSGNSLIGLMRVEQEEFDAKQQDQATLFGSAASYKKTLDDKNRKVEQYRHTSGYVEDLAFLRDEIDKIEEEALPVLDGLLLEDFYSYGIRFEQATWDAKAGDSGKPVKRALTDGDMQDLEPFHWGFEFDNILNVRGGFDAIITNPPWEGFKPQSKEFFLQHSDLFTKKTMRIEDFELQREALLKDDEVRALYLSYLSRFPHQSAYYRSAPEFGNQSTVVNGKKTGTDVNLYKLFTERCYHLLCPGGLCGIVIPSGIYTDLGTKGLRDLLFRQTRITGLFGFENRKKIFEGVDSRFKFVVLSFCKGGITERFPAAFMRLDVKDLERFPDQVGVELSVASIKRLAPDSHSIMEFKSEVDAEIAEKMARFPLLGEHLPNSWNLKLTAEFHMTSDGRKLFKTSTAPGLVPLYEGKMIWQFETGYAPIRYWVDEAEGRKALLGKRPDKGQRLDYQAYRLGFRDIASNTNERTMVAAVIPPAFHGNKLPTVVQFDEDGAPMISIAEQLFLGAVWNSFVIDGMLRQRVTTTLNFFYIYQPPIPRLSKEDARFAPIVYRALRLACTSSDFAPLWTMVQAELNGKLVDEQASTWSGAFAFANETGGQASFVEHEAEDAWTPSVGATAPKERAKVRAELDALVAHLYGLTEEEFCHVLMGFPLVAQEVKDAALAEFQKVAASRLSEETDPLAVEMVKLIQAGEGESVEFKQSLEFIDFNAAEWKEKLGSNEKVRDKRVEIVRNVIHSSLKTICGFLNGEGGTLLIGVHDLSDVIGIEHDLQMVKGKSVDGFELKIRNMLTARFDPVPVGFGQVTIHFPKVSGKTICRAM